jgi:hypothetical protein
MLVLLPFVPAKAGTQGHKPLRRHGRPWIPAYAGMNGDGGAAGAWALFA